MKKTQETSLPEDTPKAQKIAVKIVHNGMYILLGGTVLSGLLIGFLFWLGIKNSLLIDTAVNIHELIINLLYLFIVIHIIVIYSYSYYCSYLSSLKKRWCLELNGTIFYRKKIK